MPEVPRPAASEEAERRRIVSALAQAGFCLPGSVSDERTRCGKPGCRCKTEPPMLHGPYHHWTRKIDGKTVGRYLSDDQLARYSGWFDQAKRLRDLLNELQALSLRIVERTEGWEPQPPPAGHQPRSRTPGQATPRRRQQGKG